MLTYRVHFQEAQSFFQANFIEAFIILKTPLASGFIEVR